MLLSHIFFGKRPCQTEVDCSVEFRVLRRLHVSRRRLRVRGFLSTKEYLRVSQRYLVWRENVGSRRHSTTRFSENVVVAGTSYQILESFIILQPG